jgi:hypothetical protein
LFQSKISARKFKNYKCTGIGARITEVQDLNADAHAHILKGAAPPEEGNDAPVGRESVKFHSKV